MTVMYFLLGYVVFFPASSIKVIGRDYTVYLNIYRLHSLQVQYIFFSRFCLNAVLNTKTLRALCRSLMNYQAALRRESLSCWQSAKTRLDWKRSVTISKSEYLAHTLATQWPHSANDLDKKAVLRLMFLLISRSGKALPTSYHYVYYIYICFHDTLLFICIYATM